MAIYYGYEPKLSFIGKWWWHVDGAYIHPFDWNQSTHLLKPIWVRFDSEDGEDGYLRAESKDGSLIPWSPLKARAPGLLFDTFWFGAYEKNGKYYFQVRPISPNLDAQPMPLSWYLDTDLVGYMGMYSGVFKVPEWVIYIGEDLWQIKGRDLHDFVEGERIANLELSDNDDNPVTLRLQSGRPYLYTGARGRPGRVSLLILKRPYSPKSPE